MTRERRDLGQLPGLCARRAGDRPGDRVLGGVLECADESQQLVAITPGGGDDSEQLHAPGRHRARLVEHDRIHAARRLEHLRTLDQDAELRAATRADEERSRRGEAERARAGDDQHRDRGRQRVREPGALEQPERERGRGDDQHDRHEDGRDAIHETLDGCLAGLGLAHQAADLRQRRIGADPRRAHDEPASHVDRGTDDDVARPLLDRCRLAGQQRLVDCRAAFLDEAVGGNLLPRAHHEAIADAQLADRDAALAPVGPEHGHILRAELQQGVQRRARAALRALLEEAAEEDEGRHDGGHLEVGRAGVEEAEREHRPAPRGQRAKGHERVHGRGTVPEVAPGGAVERPAGPEHDGRGEREREPLPVRELQRRDHRQREHGRGKAGGDEQPQAHRAAIRCGQARGVAGRLDRLDQLRGCHPPVEAHSCALRRVVDGRVHALQHVQLAFDVLRARHAGHPLDGEIETLGGDRRGHRRR